MSPRQTTTPRPQAAAGVRALPHERGSSWQQDRFEDGFTFTQIGLGLRALGTVLASDNRYFAVDSEVDLPGLKITRFVPSVINSYLLPVIAGLSGLCEPART